MKNTESETLGKGIYYTLQDKPFWAIFYNDALHNAYLTLTHIYAKLGINDYDTEDHAIQISTRYNSFIKKANAIDKNRFLNLIHRHFPFLEAMNLASVEKKNLNSSEKKNTEYNKEANIRILNDLLAQLNEYRNFFSHHFYDKPIHLDRLDKRWINGIYDANVRRIKEDFFGVKATDNEADHTSKDPFEKEMKHLRRLIPNKDKSLKNDSGQQLKTIPNPGFKTNLISKENELYILTEYGHLLFVSLFLEKASSIRLQKNLKGLKDARETRFRMTNEVFCRSRILLPKIKLKSDNNADAFLMDMSSELAKAPKEFYNQLLSEDKNRFRTVNEESEYEEETPDDIQQILGNGCRSEDRFPYFVLRFFDENKIFNKIRFQIDLGAYHFHIYESTINQVKEKRHLTRQLYGFNRIQHFTPESAPDYWKEKEKDLDYFEEASEPFIRKTYPHYHLEGGKIGLRFHGEHLHWPNLDIEKGETKYPKYKKQPNEKAEAFLSLNELPFMIFCHLIYSSTDENTKVEKLIEAKYKGLKKLFEDVANDTVSLVQDSLDESLKTAYNLTKYDIPERLYLALAGTTQDRNLNKMYHERLTDHLAETERLIKRFQELKNAPAKVGKRNYRRFESGKFADWLAKDFMRFQPIGKKNDGTDDLRSKPNPKEYQLIQKSLAMYGLEKHNLRGLLKSCKLIDSPNAHPFLHHVINKKHGDWQQFYSDYLTQRKKYLSKCVSDVKKSQNYTPYAHFLRVKLQNKALNDMAREGWLKQLLLPTGFFMPEIRAWFEKHQPEELSKIETKNGTIPFARLVESFLQKNYSDTSQPFYDQLPLLYSHFANLHKKGLDFQKRSELLPKWKTAFKALKPHYVQWLELEKKCDDLANTLKESHISSINSLKEKFSELLGSEVNKIEIYERDKKKLVTKFKNKAFEPYKKKITKCRQFRYFFENEEVIRNFKTRDQLVSLMVREMLSYQLNASGNDGFQLREIQPIGESGVHNFLNGIQRLSQPLTIYKTDDRGQFVKDANKPKIEIGTWIVFSTDTKRKNRGTFLHFVKDRRLNNLALYIQPPQIGTIEIDRKRLEFELAAYSRERQKIVTCAHQLERTLLAKNPSLKAQGAHYLNFNKLVECLPSSVSDVLKKQLIYLRNAMLHNQYPLPELFKDEVTLFKTDGDLPEKDGLGIIRQLATIAETKFNEVIRLIQ